MRVAPSQSLKEDAQRALKKGNYKKALRCFTALERLEPENGDWSLQAGLMYHRMGKRKQSIAALERAAQRCHVQRDYKRAGAIYAQILRFDPSHGMATTGLRALQARLEGKRSSRSIELPLKPPSRVPSSSASYSTIQDPPPPARVPVGTQGADEARDGFGVPKAKADRVALALAALKA